MYSHQSRFQKMIKVTAIFTISFLIIFLLPFFINKALAAPASLFLSPASGSYQVGSSFAVEVRLNTANERIVAVSAYLTFDNTRLGVASIDTTGSAFGTEAEKIVQGNTIKITRGQATPGVNSTNALVAIINFNALASGNASLNFTLTAAGQGPSRAILDDGQGTDVLTSITNGVYTIQAAPTTNYLPIGSFDGADSIHATGWAYDQNAGASPINVHIYIDGVPTANIVANLSRPDIIGAGSGVVGDANHGFDYTFSGLAAGNHTIQVYAINTPTGTNPELTGSPRTITIAPPADTQAPSVPTGLSATAVSSSQINLSWTASTDNVGVTGYRVYRGSVQIGTATTNSYSNTGLSPSISYSYTVAAYDAAGNVSGQSASASATTQAAADTTPPSVPANLTATAVSSSQINLSWTTSTDNVGVTGYRVYRGGTQIGTATTNSYSNTGLPPSISYSYTVAAYDAAGNVSGQSASASATTQAAADTTPPIISGINVTLITYNSATINWTTNESATSQVLYGPTTSYGSQTTDDINLITSHSVLLSGLSPSTTYHFRAVSRDSAGNTSVPGDSTFTTAALPILSVSLTANPNSGTAPLNGVDLTATVSGNVTGNINYTFYCNRSDAGTNVTTPYQAKYNGLSATTRTATDVCSYSTAGTYITKVIVERGGYQAEARITIIVSVPNYLPIGNFDGADSIHATGWAYDQNTGTSAINVHIYIDGIPTANIVANLSRPDIVGAGGGVVSDANHGFDYTFSNLSVGTHTIRAYAINTPEGTNPELPGSPRTINIAPPSDTQAPSVPSGLTATAVSSSQINFSWTASTDNVGVTGYRIYRGGTQIGTATTNSYSNTGLSPSTTYSYTVAAYDAAGNVSGQSASAAAITQAAPASTINLIQTAGNSGSGTSLSTSINSSGAGNLIAVCVSSGQPPTSIADNKQNSYILAKDMIYGTSRFQLYYAYNTTGGITSVTISSPWTSNGMIVAEYSGIATSNPLDSTAGYDNIYNGGANWTSGNSAATVQANELLIGCASDRYGMVSSFTAGTNYIARRTQGGLFLEDRNVSAVGAYAAIGTHNAASGYEIEAIIATFKAAAGASTDTIAPSVPANLTATAISSSQINLSWTTSTDNVGVTGYRIFRGGVQIGTSATNLYSDTSLSPSTAYSYTVAAYDAAGNVSGQSASASATTQASTTKRGDLNNDGRVDDIDLRIFIINWGNTSRPPADINQDGQVDIIDLRILVSNWG